MPFILNIDTTSNEKIKISLLVDGEKTTLEQALDKNKAQALLPLIDQILKKNKLTLKNVSEINLNPGPGSFTGIRVGLTIANTLAYLLKIPINDKPLGVMEKPIYS